MFLSVTDGQTEWPLAIAQFNVVRCALKVQITLECLTFDWLTVSSNLRLILQVLNVKEVFTDSISRIAKLALCFSRACNLNL